jgi:hypothetical protein
MRPNGDPEGMRREAHALMDEASRIRAAARSVPEVPEWAFFAPAATRLRARLTDIRNDGLRAAGIVEAAAQTLYSEASRLEQAIRDWEDEQRRLSQRSSSR